MSLCVTSFQASDIQLRNKAALVYQQSLYRLQTAVSNLTTKKELCTAVAVACFASGISEYMFGDWNHSDVHLDAAARVLKRCDPHDIHEAGLQQIIWDHRALWLGCCFTRRVASVYSSDNWMNLTQKMPVPSTQIETQSLCDLICGVMPLYESYYTKGQTSTEISGYARQLEGHTTALREWRRRSPVTWPGKVPSEGLSALDQALSVSYYSSYMSHLCLMRLDIRRRLGVSGAQGRFGDQAEVVSLTVELKEVLTRLLNDEFGFQTRMHVPFAIHSCWTALKEAAQLDREWRKWFNWADNQMQRGGIRPFTTPWRKGVHSKDADKLTEEDDDKA